MGESEATYMGQKANQGVLTPGRLYPKEGYASLRCGGTEVRIGYTLLHHMRIDIDSASSAFIELSELSKALYAITCEASLGKTGKELS